MRFIFYFIFLIPMCAFGNSQVFVGLANAYKYSSGSEIGIEFPLQFSGLLINASSSPSFLSAKYLIGDGTTHRPFILVDRSSGSELDLRIEKISFEIRKKLKVTSFHLSNSEKEKVLQFLQKNLELFIRWSQDSDSQLPSENFQKHATRLKILPIGKWIETSQLHLVEPFENILDRKEGVCIDMALLASFILEKFEIQHRVIFGSVQAFGETGSGHTWILLPDARILDVAWKTLSPPDYTNQDGWTYFGNELGKQFRFPYQFFPLIQIP